MDNNIVGYTKSLGCNNGTVNEMVLSDILKIVFSTFSGSDLGNVFLTCTYWTSFRQFCISLATPKEARILQRYFNFTEEKVKIYNVIHFEKLDEKEAKQVREASHDASSSNSISQNKFTLCLFSNTVYQGMASIKFNDYWKHNMLTILPSIDMSEVDQLVDQLEKAKAEMDLFTSFENKGILVITAMQSENLDLICYGPLHTCTTREISRIFDVSVRDKFDVSSPLGNKKICGDFYLTKKQGDIKPIGFQKVKMDEEWRFSAAFSNSQNLKELIDYMKQFPEEVVRVQKKMKDLDILKFAEGVNDSEYLQQLAILMSLLPQED